MNKIHKSKHLNERQRDKRKIEYIKKNGAKRKQRHNERVNQNERKKKRKKRRWVRRKSKRELRENVGKLKEMKIMSERGKEEWTKVADKKSEANDEEEGRI